MLNSPQRLIYQSTPLDRNYASQTACQSIERNESAELLQFKIFHLEISTISVLSSVRNVREFHFLSSSFGINKSGKTNKFSLYKVKRSLNSKRKTQY